MADSAEVWNEDHVADLEEIQAELLMLEIDNAGEHATVSSASGE